MTDFSILWAASVPIPLHALLALTALGLGTFQLFMPKGTASHRFTGHIWVAFMAGTAITGLFIHELQVWGLFSPIHLLIPITLISLWIAIRAARQGKIKRHRKIMVFLFFLALVVTGLFTLLPGRVMHAAFFGGT